MKKNLLIIFLLFVISVWGLKSLFGGPYFTSQDGIHQVARLYHFKLSLKDGVFPPRFANHAFFDYGYPLFHFNYHLPWYASLPLIFLRIEIFDIIKILNFLAYFLSGVFMFLFLKELTKKNFPAFLGTVIFMVSPYRFLNIYVRNALGESFAFMFFPLIFLFLLRIAKRQKFSDVILLSLSLAGIILSHAMSFVIFSPAIFVFGIYSLCLSNKKKKFVLYVALSGLLFVGISAYYLLPAFLETRYTQFNQRFSTIFRLSLLNIKDIIYSPWGYAGNGSDDAGRMSFQFGLSNWLTLGMCATFSLLIFRKIKKRTLVLILLSFFCVVFSLFLTLNQTMGIWQEIEKFFKIDFPWKYIGIAVFWISILVSLVFSEIKSKKAAALVGLTIIFLAFYSNRNHIKVNEYTSFDIPSAIFAERGTNTEDEYLPKWARENMKLDEFVHPKKRIEVQVKEGNYKLENIIDKTHYFSYRYEGGASEQTVRKFYFPGWVVKLNGKKINFIYGTNGYFNFSIPSGKSKIEIFYEGTQLSNNSDLISIFAGLFVLGFGLNKFLAPKLLGHHSPKDKN